MKLPGQQTIREVVLHGIREYNNLPCLSYVNNEAVTYAELGGMISNFQSKLQQQGIRKGDRVAILGPNMPNWVVAYLSVTSMGAIAVPVMPEFTPAEIRQVLNHSLSKLLIASEKQLARIEGEDLPDLQHRVLLEDLTVTDDSPRDENRKADTSLNRPGADLRLIPAEVNEDDLAAIIYTSGTTGNSKGVMLTHRNIVFDALQGFTVQPATTGDVFLSILPLAHTYENTIGLMLPLLGGSQIVYLDKPPTASVLLPALAAVRPTLMLSVPLVIEKVFRNSVLPKFTHHAVLRFIYGIPLFRRLLHLAAGRKLMKTFGGRLKFFGIGGAKLDAKVEQFLREARFPFAIGYGLTETSPLVAGGIGKNIRFQSTGRVLPEVEVSLRNDPETGQPEILVRGSNVMKGYYKRPDLTAEVMTSDGWFRTGDLGYFDNQKNLHINGRLKNIIIGANGKNIIPEEIESVINTFHHVLESVVVKQKDKLVALVHLNKEEVEARLQVFLNDAKQVRQEAVRNVEQAIDDLLKELLEYVNARVNKFSQLQAVIYQPQPFEKTATQKIKRYLYS